MNSPPVGVTYRNRRRKNAIQTQLPLTYCTRVVPEQPQNWQTKGTGYGPVTGIMSGCMTATGTGTGAGATTTGGGACTIGGGADVVGGGACTFTTTCGGPSILTSEWNR